MVVDDMHDTTAWAYAAMPDRIYVIDTEGDIYYKSLPGPQGFRPRQMREALEDLLLLESIPGR